MKAYFGSWDIAPCVLHLGTRCRWVISFTPRPLYLQRKSPWYPLDRRLDGPQSRSGRCGEEKNFQALPGLEPSIIQLVAQRYTTELSRLLLHLYTDTICVFPPNQEIMLHNLAKQLVKLNCITSPNIIRVTTSRRMRWAGKVARMRERWETHTWFWLDNLRGRDHLEDLGVDKRKIWKRILRKQGVKMWTGISWLRTGISGEFL
jgi:hypothetical protein